MIACSNNFLMVGDYFSLRIVAIHQRSCDMDDTGQCRSSQWGSMCTFFDTAFFQS